jgi:hypothetical protein
MKTRNSTLVTLLLVLALLVTACGSAAAGSSTDAAATENASGSLSDSTKLALGILKLEDTDQAITLEQAQELLTLWQAYQALGNSETTAAMELEALVKQIQATLTDEQVSAIEAMDLNSESLREVMQAFGDQFSPGGTPGAQSTPQAGSGFQGFQDQQGMPGGGGFQGGGQRNNPPSGGFPGGGADGDGEMMMGPQGTPGADDQNRFNALGSQVNPMLLSVLINMLEEKVQPAE